MSSPEHKQKIWNLIKDVRNGMLTTRHGDELRSRPMALVQDEWEAPAARVWIGNPTPVVDMLDPEHPGRIWLPFNETCLRAGR